MWTPATRRQHSRDELRYETDLTDAEWALLEPLMPEPNPRGRPREWPLREIMNAIFYVLRGGVAWRLLPNDLPPRTTVYRWFSQWRDTGLFESMNGPCAQPEPFGGRTLAPPVHPRSAERFACLNRRAS